MGNDVLHLEADLDLVQHQFSGVCRRRASRFHFDLGAIGYLVSQEGGSSQEVWLLDISELGIGFWSYWPLPRGTELVLKLTSRAGNTIKLQAKVAHATKQARGDWRIGCEFHTQLTPEVLDELL